METDTVDPDLPLIFDAVGSEQVGDLVHTLVGRLVRAELSVAELRGAASREITAGVLSTEVDVEIGDDEWESLHIFLTEYVLPELAASGLWSRVERATAVYVEEPLHGVACVDGVDIEVQGAADLVVVLPDGTHTIEELKVALAPLTDTLRRRYRIQAQTYAWVLEQQVSPDVDVEALVTTIGAVTGTDAVRAPTGVGALIDRQL